ncbi:hypothetical protein CGLO_10773 [Colletotrichum gloeosporioides Cg-14]|uniref:Uncharacterized protein n=1 Tax=Colletotrichum gloeosporioides (strain Cg-14) TaxID=1237896 RepID=T0LNP8_COLGC|nr:hypothetical protein CGLO_10773 [Colletotrichum gloeosporioides Cg-14]
MSEIKLNVNPFGCHVGGTTWAREKNLWDSRDHKKAVLAYWSLGGVNTRSEKLGLDPVKGPFVLECIISKMAWSQDYDTDEEEEQGSDRRTTEDSDVNDGGVADGEDPDLDSDNDSYGDEEETESSDREDEYLVEEPGFLLAVFGLCQA